MPHSATPFLMFEGRAEEAMRLYASTFEGAEIISTEYFGTGQPGPEGSVKRGLIRVAGQQLICFDSPAKHAFGFTPALSLFVTFQGAAELDAAFAILADGGSVLMPLGDYGFSARFGWINDRFGVSWQLNLER